MSSVMTYKTNSGKKRWKAQVYVGLDEQGKKHYAVKGGFKKKTDAKQAGKKLDIAVANGTLTAQLTQAQHKPTFRDIYQEWVPTYKLTVRESSFAKTLSCFELHVLPAFGGMQVDTITTKDIQNALAGWYKQSPTNFRRYYVWTNKILRYALDNEYIPKNPATKVIMPRRQERVGNVTDFWDKDQLAQFFADINWHKDLHKYVLFRVLAYTGIRIGEAMALEWDDVDFQKRTLNINKTRAQGMHGRTLVNPPKTRGSRRVVPMDEDTVNWLRQWRDVEPTYLRPEHPFKSSHQLVWCSTNNKPLKRQHPARWFATYTKASGLQPISLHKLRHGYISNLLLAGVPVSTVQKLVGHVDPKITLAIYAHVHSGDEQQAAEVLAEFLKSGQKVKN